MTYPIQPFLPLALLFTACAAGTPSAPPPDSAEEAAVAAPPAPPPDPPAPTNAPAASVAPPPIEEPQAVTDSEVVWTQLKGRPGKSQSAGSGWLELETVRDFAKGTKLRISVGGTADTVAVRLLNVHESPDDAVGIIGNYRVPTDRIVAAEVSASYGQIGQVSVHGRHAWGLYGSPDNGPATLELVEVAEPRP